MKTTRRQLRKIINERISARITPKVDMSVYDSKEMKSLAKQIEDVIEEIEYSRALMISYFKEIKGQD